MPDNIAQTCAVFASLTKNALVVKLAMKSYSCVLMMNRIGTSQVKEECIARTAASDLPSIPDSHRIACCLRTMGNHRAQAAGEHRSRDSSTVVVEEQQQLKYTCRQMMPVIS